MVKSKSRNYLPSGNLHYRLVQIYREIQNNEIDSQKRIEWLGKLHKTLRTNHAHAEDTEATIEGQADIRKPSRTNHVQPEDGETRKIR